MNILWRGAPPDDKSWLEKRFLCERCESVVELDPPDEQYIHDYVERPNHKSMLKADCPVCLRTTHFSELGIPEPIALIEF